MSPSVQMSVEVSFINTSDRLSIYIREEAKNSEDTEGLRAGEEARGRKEGKAAQTTRVVTKDKGTHRFLTRSEAFLFPCVGSRHGPHPVTEAGGSISNNFLGYLTWVMGPHSRSIAIEIYSRLRLSLCPQAMYCLGGGIKNQKNNEKMVTGVLGEAVAGARPARAQLKAWPSELSLEEQGLYNQS